MYVVQRAFTLLFFCFFLFFYYSLMLDSADGEYAVTTMTKAILHSDGHVKWLSAFTPRHDVKCRFYYFDTFAILATIY